MRVVSSFFSFFSFFNFFSIVCCLYHKKWFLHNTLRVKYLVDFDDSVNLGDKPETSKETNCTSQQEEKKHNDEGVTEIQEGTGCSMNLQLGHKIVNTVSEEVHRSETTGQERTPPPVVVFSTEMEITQ